MACELMKQIKECNACRNHIFRTRVVPGSGNKAAKIMVIGEGPGKEEDKDGRPFLGEAGQNLDKILEEASLNRKQDLFITNIVKCRATKMGKKGLVNRRPTKKESQACRSFLLRQIEIVSPKLIICIGAIPAQRLLETDATLEALMREPQTVKDIPVIPTFHTSNIGLNLDPSRRPKIVKVFREAREKWMEDDAVIERIYRED